MRAREIWKMKLQGMDSDAIANKLSINKEIINQIIAYTNSNHYTIVKRNMTSYYDDNLFYAKSISLKKNKLNKLNASLVNKKLLFQKILIGTVGILVVMIII